MNKDCPCGFWHYGFDDNCILPYYLTERCKASLPEQPEKLTRNGSHISDTSTDDKNKPEQPPDKITAHWLEIALSRIRAGEDEEAVMDDYGYVPNKSSKDKL